MSHYGVTAIRWNTAHTDIEACLVHEIDRENGEFVLRDGAEMPYSDIASLIVQGDKVWVMVQTDAGAYEKSESVEIERKGRQERLRSSPGNCLFGLLTF